MVLLPRSGTLLVACDDKRIHQWRAESAKSKRLTEAETRKYLAQLDDESFRARQEAVQALSGAGDAVLPLLDAVNPKDNPSLADSIRGIRQSIAQARLPRKDAGETPELTATIRALAAHPDGTTWAAIAGSGPSSELLLGRATDAGPEIVERLSGFSAPRALAFSGDGRSLYVGNGDSTISVYELAFPDN
jgi:hypothetical protein